MTVPREKSEPRKLPMMPIRDMVIFPYMMTPFVVGRESSVRALEEALTADRKIFLATQHDASIDEPKAKDIYQVGSICNIVQSVKMPDGNIKVLVEGVERAKSIEVNDRDGFFVATVRTGKREFEMTPAAEQLMQRVTSLFEQYVKLQQSLNYETIGRAFRGKGSQHVDLAVGTYELGKQMALCDVAIERSGKTKVPNPPGKVRIEVKDGSTGALIPARVGLYDSTGRIPLPSDQAVLVERFADKVRSSTSARAGFGHQPIVWVSM